MTARPLASRRAWRWTSWPRRTLWPTRDGWWCLAAAIVLGIAAMNTGNNLLYVLVSMLLGLIVVSGMLSEQSMRGLQFAAIVPREAFAGSEAMLGVRLTNRKRWRASYSIAIDVAGDETGDASGYVPRLDAGGDAVITWTTTFATRGMHDFPRLRVSTRFPFGLFVKAGQVALTTEILVYPRRVPVASTLRPDIAAGGASVRRRGRGSDLHNLREYRPGDDPRTIHWRSSAKTGALVVRELEAETAVDARLVLDGSGRETESREHGLAVAASLASELLRAGARVALAGPGVHVPLGDGREHRARVLTALALWQPTSASTPGAPPRATVREIRIPI